MLAGLVRGLVHTCHEAALREEPYPATRPEVLRVAHWRAARYGLEAELVDVHGLRRVPAHELIESLLSFVRPALEEHGEWEEVSSLAHETLRRGNSAARQRRAFQRSGQLEDVVAMLIEETARGTEVG